MEGDYRIVVKGEFGQRFETAFEGMTVAPGDGVTVMRGRIADRSHLHGILEQVHNLGLDLVSVEPSPLAVPGRNGD